MCLVNSMKYGTSKGTCLVMEIWNYYVNHGDKEYQGRKVCEKSDLLHWRPKAAAMGIRSNGRRRVPQAVGQRQQPAGSIGWVEEHLAAFPRSLGSLDFPIKGSHLLENPWATTALRASWRT